MDRSLKRVKRQCSHCPWRKSTAAGKDIPGGYCRTKHEALRGTLADGLNIGQPLRMMACHESPVGRERVCVGWAMHQLTDGNNIALRYLAVMDPDAWDLELDGEQHATFEDTLT